MSMTIEKTGKTIQDAINAAVKEINVKEEDLVIEVIDEGDSGNILGIGRREAKVRVSYETTEDVYYGDDDSFNGGPKSQEEEKAVYFVNRILTGIGVRGTISSKSEEDTIYIDVTGKDIAAAIGRHGETMDAIQYLTNLVVNKERESRLRVILDISGYRKRREESLRSLAIKIAEKVVRVGKSYEMEPMSSSERRAIHAALQDFPGVTTFSEGEEPERCVVISPDRK